jgi:hypothetical protein
MPFWIIQYLVQFKTIGQQFEALKVIAQNNCHAS